MSSDEKNDRDLDADILQGKADILKALRAAGKPVSNESDSPSAEPNKDSVDDLDIIDTNDDEQILTEPGSDEDISWPEEAEILSESNSTEEPELTIVETSEISDPVSPSEEHKSAPQPDVRRLQSRIAALTEENERLNADLRDHIQDTNQTQRLRFELSQIEVSLSRERSSARMLETKLNEVESLKLLLEQDCQALSEKIETLGAEKQQLSEKFNGLQTEHADYR